MKLLVLGLISFASLLANAEVQSHACEINSKKLVIGLDKGSREITLNSKKIPTQKTLEFGNGGIESEFYKPLSTSLCKSLLAVDYNDELFFVPLNHDNATDGQRQALILLLKKSDFSIVSTHEVPLAPDATVSEGKVFFSGLPILDGSVGNTVRIKGNDYSATETKFPVWSSIEFDRSNKALLRQNLAVTYQNNRNTLPIKSEDDLKSLLKWNDQSGKFEKVFVFKASAKGKPDCYAASAKQSLAKLEWSCEK